MSRSGLWRLLIAFLVVFNCLSLPVLAGSITVYKRVVNPGTTSAVSTYLFFDSETLPSSSNSKCLFIRPNDSHASYILGKPTSSDCLASLTTASEFIPVFGNEAYPLPYPLMRALLQFLIFHGCMILMTKMFLLGT